MIMCSIFLFNVRYLSPCGFPILCGRGELSIVTEL